MRGNASLYLYGFISYSRKQYTRVWIDVAHIHSRAALYWNGCIRAHIDPLRTDIQGPAYSQCCNLAGPCISVCCRCRAVDADRRPHDLVNDELICKGMLKIHKDITPKICSRLDHITEEKKACAIGMNKKLGSVSWTFSKNRWPQWLCIQFCMYKQYGEALGLETNIMDILTKPCYAPMIVFLALAHLQQKTHFGHSAFRHASKHGGVLFTMATKAMSIAVSDQLTRLQEIAHYTHCCMYIAQTCLSCNIQGSTGV